MTNKKTNIVLIGFMGSGKTTIGKLLEKSTGKKLVDIDKSIEQKTKTKIKKIFALYGEAHFRKLETLAVKVVAKKKNMIIATGGGVVKKQENINLLKKTGVMVYLKSSFKTIVKRVGGRKTRPLFDTAHPEQAEALFKSRLALYKAAADIVVDTDKKGKNEVGKIILKNFFIEALK
ncbi:MAG: shikimate kinase [bacterium]